ncbi:Alpha/Beta hydrolase protein [Lophiotrema nucula]|uniref:Alpha/Beta hydrolase protein n=1 Tax=Lophiotrema nucula TaxID=690887 RepID=A0A6A5YRP8_9PLEO|nr:Alpha/Beta hydrolase protein [Lophiotrema nucula]
MAAIEEGWHTVEDGKKLYTKTWKTESPAKARLVFLHGFSDHCNQYGNLFPALASKGIEVYAFDQRGWGRSAPEKSDRGNTGPTTRVLDDITSFLKTVIPCPIPLFLMGHSMGGGETYLYAAEGPEDIRKHIRGYLFESPFVDFDPKSKPSPITVFFGRFAGRIMPHHQMVNRLDIKLVAKDETRRKQLFDDELCHDTGTLEGLAGLLDRTSHLNTGKIIIGEGAGEGGVTRVWVGHGTKDGVTAFDASKKFFDRIEAKDKEFKAYEGYFHRLHDEPSPEREVFVNDVADWISARSIEPVQGDAGKPKL